MKQFLTSFLIIISLNSAFACYNGLTNRLRDGTVISQEKYDEVYLIPVGYEFFPLNYDKKLKQLDSIWKATNDIDYLSDYALVLALKKDYKRAIEVYLEIEKLKPNRYATASNLGTTYELTGQNEQALKWIKKAVSIDPHSHNDSEWIHVNILEAKIKGEKFITTEFLLNTDFGKEAYPTSNLSREKLDNLRYALYYQLNERVSFIKSNDKIMAQLMFDLGNIAVLTHNRFKGIEIYKIAKKYGFSDPIIEARIKFAETHDTNNAPFIDKDTIITKSKDGQPAETTYVREYLIDTLRSATKPVSYQSDEVKRYRFLSWLFLGITALAGIAIIIVRKRGK